MRSCDQSETAGFILREKMPEVISGGSFDHCGLRRWHDVTQGMNSVSKRVCFTKGLSSCRTERIKTKCICLAGEGFLASPEVHCLLQLPSLAEAMHKQMLIVEIADIGLVVEESCFWYRNEETKRKRTWKRLKNGNDSEKKYVHTHTSCPSPATWKEAIEQQPSPKRMAVLPENSEEGSFLNVLNRYTRED